MSEEQKKYLSQYVHALHRNYPEGFVNLSDEVSEESTIEQINEVLPGHSARDVIARYSQEKYDLIHDIVIVKNDKEGLWLVGICNADPVYAI